ncbi:MAG: transposase [Sedimentisphaerales bacterium]
MFRFRQSHSASVAREVFGQKDLAGVLVVDRYNGYSKIPCSIQRCYAHLLRDVRDLEKDSPVVIARKISFGSQSDAGAGIRKILMTILHT